MWQWILTHPQRCLGFLQVTLSQIALWDCIPVKVALAISSAAGLFQVWTAFLKTPAPDAAPAQVPDKP